VVVLTASIWSSDIINQQRQEFGKMGSNIRFQLVHSSHYVPFDAPAAIVDAIEAAWHE
jgi:carboxypeptidase C (cathepsin A)